MIKKSLSLLFIFALLSSAGCYTNEVIPREKYPDLKSEITVILKDGKECKYSEDIYKISKDTLYRLGNPKAMFANPQKIPLDKIKTIKSAKLNAFRTGILIGTTVILLYAIIKLINNPPNVSIE